MLNSEDATYFQFDSMRFTKWRLGFLSTIDEHEEENLRLVVVFLGFIAIAFTGNSKRVNG